MKKLTLIIIAAFISLSAASQDYGNYEKITIENVSDSLTIITSKYYYTYSLLLIQIDRATGYPEYYPYYLNGKTLYKLYSTRNRKGYKYMLHITATRGDEVFTLTTEI